MDMNTRRTLRGISAAAITMALAAALLVVPTASAQVPISEADFSGYATGTVIHAHALQSGTTRLGDVEVSFSGASVDSMGLAPEQLNEMERVVHPALTDKMAHARGTGLEVGVVRNPPSAENQIELAGHAEADAPPTEGPITEELGPVKVDPLAYASTVKGEATARWQDDVCILGADISRGLGYAEDAEVFDLGGNDSDSLDAPLLATNAPDNGRAITNSLSRTALVPQRDQEGNTIGPAFGLLSENRQTIAPVTLFSGTPNQTRIEFLGEWVLRAVATGLPGGAYVHYGPGEVSPQTPILQVELPGGDPILVATQDILGPEGLAIDLPGGLGQIVVGEDPRAIGGDQDSDPTVAADGTLASAAVDVVRVQLNADSLNADVLDFRIGHMEVQAQVPAGGISCPLPVTKVAQPESVDVGNAFTTTITINNPYDCDLTEVRVTDEITTVGSARFRVDSTDPTADQVPSGENLRTGTVVWNDVGPIPSGESRSISVTLTAQGGAGRIDDIASATGVLANCTGEDASVAGSAVSAAGAGLVGSSNPVRVPVGAVEAAVLARTGPMTTATVAAGLLLMLLAGLGLRASRRIA